MKMFIEPPNITSSDIKALFTTKVPGSSHIGEIIAKELNISKGNIFFPVQQHTDRVFVLESDLEPKIADAVITDRKNILIGVLVADCVPILLCDREKRVIGAVHAGWRGTSTQILKNTIKTMQERFHCSTGDILIAIGPSIRQCCYNVGDDVKTAIQKATGVGTTRFREGVYYHEQDDKCFLDLSSANKIQALDLGIPQQNIWQSEECTFCNPDRFYSYRYSKDSAGRQGGVIGMW